MVHTFYDTLDKRSILGYTRVVESGKTVLFQDGTTNKKI